MTTPFEREPEKPYQTTTTKDGATRELYGPMVEIAPGVIGPSHIIVKGLQVSAPPRRKQKRETKEE